MLLEGGTEAADERVEAAPGLAEQAWAQSQGRAGGGCAGTGQTRASPELHGRAARERG
jgi:hypothetical protein